MVAKKPERKSRTASARPKKAAAAPYHHGALKAALVASARRILEQKGFEALSLRAAAERAGVSRQAPYHHFADKSSLIAAVATEGFRELAAAMEERMLKETTPQARLRACGVGYVVFAANNPALFRLMFGGTGSNFANDRVLDAAREASFALLEQAMSGFDAARSSEQLRIDRLAAWSTVHGLAELVIRGVIKPAGLGLRDAEALANAVLSGPHSVAERAG